MQNGKTMANQPVMPGMKGYTADGFRNFVAGVGVGGQDKAAANTYIVPQINLVQCENIYRSSGFGRRVVDIPAGDMTREWRTWMQDADAMHSMEKKLNIQRLIKDAITVGLKQGGAGIYIGVKGVTDPSEPLDPEKVGKDQLEYLTLFGREELTVVEAEEDALSPRYRKGKIYSINRGEGSSLRIHWTRFAWFGALPTSTNTAEKQDGWDDPIYTTLQPLIESADSALMNIRALIHEARVDVLKIPELTKYFEDSESESRLKQRVLLTQHLKSNMHMLVLDGTEDHDTRTMQFSGLVDVYAKTLESLSGAADIPITRFLGTSPKGMNATGDSDMRNYYDGIAARQGNELEPALSVFDQVLFRHTTGKAPDDTQLYIWNPLWQQTEKEKAETAKVKAETTKIYSDLGLFEPEFFANTVLDQIKDDELYPGIEQRLAELANEDEAIQITIPKETQSVETNPGEVGVREALQANPEQGSESSD